MLEARTNTARESDNYSSSKPKGADSHSHTEVHTEKLHIAAQEAVQVEHVEDFTPMGTDTPHESVQPTDLNKIRERLNKLESSGSTGSEYHSTEVATMVSHRKHLTPRVTAVQKCSDIAELTSVDVDLLKHEPADHVAHCKAEHQDQAETIKALADSMKSQLQKRIDKNFDLRGHLYDGHSSAGSLRLVETKRPTRALTSPRDQGSVGHAPAITEIEQRFTSSAAQDDQLIVAQELLDTRDITSQLNTWAGNIRLDFDECKKGVAEDVTTLVAHMKALGAKCENLQAQLKIVRRNMQNTFLLV
jgi:hypothetical protein